MSDLAPAIVVHSLADARAALAAAGALDSQVVLASAPGAGAAGGPAWFKALVERAAAEFPGRLAGAVLDCGDEAGTALAALRHGLTRVVFSGGPEAERRLAEIAAGLGARIEEAPPEPRLDLAEAADPAAACRTFLGGGAFKR